MTQHSKMMLRTARILQREMFSPSREDSPAPEEEMNQEVPSDYFQQMRLNEANRSKLRHRPFSPPPIIRRSRPTSPSVSLAVTSEVTSEDNWQGNLKSVKQRNAAMFNNELMADVIFKVGTTLNKQRIPAHRYILATGSSVFFAQFYGGLADTQMEAMNEIEIPDVEPAAFLKLLKYLYCDAKDLEPDTVISTLYAAKKYMVPHLAQHCVNFLETNLNANNACVLLSQSRLFDEQDLMKRCWEVIDAQTEEALGGEGFVDIDFSTLEAILQRETLNACEKSIFEAAVRWAEAECIRKNVTVTPENKRIVLGRTLHMIRIPAMSIEEFADGAAQSGILTSEETTAIFLYFTASTKPELSFKCSRRSGLQALICSRFKSSAYRSNQWRYRGRCDSIQFNVDRRIFIVGYGLYGSSSGTSEYKVKIELKRNGFTLGHKCTTFITDGRSNTFAICFDNPIQIEPETYYTASAILDGTDLSYFGQEGMADIQVGKVKFHFQCSSDSTNGTGVQGGQIPELIFYA